MYHKFDFSVIVPTFLFESDLAELLENFLTQSIGFAGHIQLILVGKDEVTPEASELRSTSRSKLPGLRRRFNEVADQFQLGDTLHGVRFAGNRTESEPRGEIVGRLARRYPSNVLVLKQDSENIGEIFNAAVSGAEGRYLVFVDRFCRWDRNAFQAMYDFLEHPDNAEAPLATGQILCDDHHSIFPGNNISNVSSRMIASASLNPRPAFEIAGCAIRAETAAENSFDSSTSTYACRIYLDRLIVSAGRFGYVKEATVLLRKADMDLDLKKGSTEDADTFRMPFAENFTPYFFIPWVQKQTFNELAVFLYKRKIPDGRLTQGEIDAYFENVIGLFEKADPELILSNKNLPDDMKKAMALASRAAHQTPTFVFCRINNVIVNPTTVEVVGEAVIPAFREYALFLEAKINNKIVKCTMGKTRDFMCFAGRPLVRHCPFRITTANNNRQKSICISFITRYCDTTDHKKSLGVGQFLPFDISNGSYAVLGNRLVHMKNGEIILELTSDKIENKAEKSVLKNLAKGNKQRKKIAAIRLICRLQKKLSKKTVVLCTDDDASTAMHAASIANALAKDPTYSVIYSGNGQKYFPLADRVRKVSKTSRKYRFCFLLSDIFVSSNANLCLTAPFGPITNEFRDYYYTKPFVYLPDMLSVDADCRYDKNAAYRVVRSIPERDAFLDGAHGYTHESLWLVPENADEAEYVSIVEKKLRNLSRRG